MPGFGSLILVFLGVIFRQAANDHREAALRQRELAGQIGNTAGTLRAGLSDVRDGLKQDISQRKGDMETRLRGEINTQRTETNDLRKWLTGKIEEQQRTHSQTADDMKGETAALGRETSALRVSVTAVGQVLQG